MAWSAPMTAVSNSVFTAAQFNTFVRDNLNETAPAKATTTGRWFVTGGLNSVVEREIGSNTIATSESLTGTTSYSDLATVGPTLTVTTSDSAIVMLSALQSNDTAGAQTLTSVEVGGASALAASDTNALRDVSAAANNVSRATAVTNLTTLTPGSNVFTMKYRITNAAQTGTWAARHLIVFAR